MRDSERLLPDVPTLSVRPQPHGNGRLIERRSRPSAGGPAFAVRAQATNCFLVACRGIAYSRHEMETTVCGMCEKSERDCKCDRYCCICMGQYGIRLCSDGLYYCPDCREACQVNVVNREHP